MENSFPLFEVPIVSPELSQEEMIYHIADSLDYLSTVVDTVFTDIRSGIAQQHQRLAALNTRAQVAKSKIVKLTGSKSATKVFSSAKFPAVDAYHTYKSVFANTKKLKPPEHQESDFVKKKNLNEGAGKEKLLFFHVRSKDKPRNDYVPKDGLGSIPSNLDSIASLLLFNTAEIPYKNYKPMDPMKVSVKTKNEEKEDTKSLDAAPDSIALGEKMPAQTTESYLYSPSLGEVPGLDLPMDLPDLPGVADDLRFSLELGTGCAPSVASTPALPDLPSIIPELPVVVPDKIQEPAATLPFVVAPPPPPAPPVLPPPPPPPPPPPVEVPETQEKPAVAAPKIIPASDDGRANLMDAIRKAGGSLKLRSVRENQDEVRRKKEEKAIAAGGDLMADLHNRLLMRRKGISGVKVGGDSVMDKVSGMIPPPPAQNDTASSATEDDDWD